MRRRIRRVRKGACGRRPVATLAPRPQAYLTDESGQGLRPPKGRTWGRRGCTPVVTVTGGHDTRVSLAALIAVRPGCGPRLIFRTHRARRADKRKGFTETDYARFLDAAHQQLDGPVVLVWDYVARNIIPVLCPAVLCGQRRLAVLVTGGDGLGGAVAGHIMLGLREAASSIP